MEGKTLIGNSDYYFSLFCTLDTDGFIGKRPYAEDKKCNTQADNSTAAVSISFLHYRFCL